jgi:Fungal specific transcription factor domain/Fungal Zn(2)-Cys(6) binuclear cluster domain
MVESGTNSDRKKRKSTARSVAGCVTCKSVIPTRIVSVPNPIMLTRFRVRHIKCDEQKPSCYNCLKSSRQCDGYSADGRRTDQDLIKIVHWKPNALALHRLSVDLAGEQEERRAIHFFRSNSVRALQGYFNSEFWSRLVLQASHTEPTIRHAVIALGSLHETTQSKDHAVLKMGKGYDKFALQHCNKAIANLTQLCTRGERSIEVLLISCALFVCFETLQGNYESALTHMESGVRMYRNWQAQNGSSGSRISSGSRHIIDKEIAQIFSRLNLQVLMFPDTHLLGKEFYTMNVNPLIDPPPESFSCLKEARDRLDNCMSYVFESIIVTYFSRQDFVNHTQKLSPEYQTYRTLLSQWSRLFGAFMTSSGVDLGPENRQRARLLQIQYKVAIILFATGMSPQETAFDAFNSDFDSIAAMASSLVGNNQGPGMFERTGQFSFDMGVVPPLYFTASRCRDPSIRRRALSILSANSRQEGVWSSDMLAKIAERLICIEEDGIERVTSSHDVLATSRVSVLNATIYSEQRRILLELCRPKGNINGELDLLDEWVAY